MLYRYISDCRPSDSFHEGAPMALALCIHTRHLQQLDLDAWRKFRNALVLTCFQKRGNTSATSFPRLHTSTWCRTMACIRSTTLELLAGCSCTLHAICRAVRRSSSPQAICRNIAQRHYTMQDDRSSLLCCRPKARDCQSFGRQSIEGWYSTLAMR